MEHEKNVVEAVLINEKLRGKAPKGWDSTEVIRAWRSRRLWPTSLVARWSLEEDFRPKSMGNVSFKANIALTFLCALSLLSAWEVSAGR